MAFEPFLAYSASAGSGKTYALTVRYVSLLFMDQSPATILTATFTNKAAAEMRSRIVEALRTFGEDGVFLQKVAEETGLSREALVAKKEEVFRRFLRTPNHIVTMDAFFAFILRSAAFEIGLEPDFETKETRAKETEEHFLNDVYRERLLAELVRLSIHIEDKRFKRLFGIFEELYRLDPLLPDVHYPPREAEKIEADIDALRREMMRRLEAVGASKSALQAFGKEDFKAFIEQGVFDKVTLADHRNFKKPLRADATLDVLFGEIKEAIAQWYRAKEGAVLHYLFTLYDHFKNAAVETARETKRLSFDDVSYFTYRLLHHSLSRDFLYFKLDTRFKHILLDEFQDTSTLQFLMLKPLIDEIFAGSGQSEFRSFFYVGDTKQSLYRFRGGVEALFDKVAKHYGITVAHLDTNYRSSKAVVETVNRLFAPVMEDFVPQRPKEGAREGFVRVMESDEVMIQAVKEAKALMAKGVSASHIAFLVHTNKEGAELQELCEAHDVPTVLQTRSTLRYLPHIAALVSALKYLAQGNPLDIEPLCTLAQKPLASVDTSWFRPSIAPLDALDRLVSDFEVFFDDANVLRLLEFAARFTSVETFLEEFDEASIDVASHSLHGARIMTVHGSKGLEFPYVIVLDRIGRGSVNNAPLLYRYDENLHIARIFYRMAKRDRVDEAYAEAIEAQREAERKDKLNALYVALTRAAEGMIIIKKPEASSFDLVGLTPMERGKAVPSGKEESETSPPVLTLPPLCAYGPQRVERTANEAYDVQAVRRGEALHYALEMLAEFAPEALPEAIEAMRNRYGALLRREDIDAIARRIARLLETPVFMEKLEGAKIHKEAAFVSGGEFRRIDLLLEYDDGVYVIDYKSTFAPTPRSDYKEQVRLYVEAAERFLNKPAGGALLYVEEDEARLEEIISLNIS